MEEKRKGELFVGLATFANAFLPVIAVVSFAVLPNLVSLAYATLFAALCFGIVVLYRRTWKEFQNQLLWRYSFLIALFFSIFYCMFFVGLSKTTPGNAAIISLFEVCTSFLLFNVWAKETFSADYKLGAILMILGALIVLAPSFSHVNVGDSIIFISMFVAPLGNFYQQKARKIASAETMLFLRNVFSAAMVFGVTYLFGLHASLVQLRTSLPYLLINGVLILGFSKLFWIEGIHRISVTKGVAFNSAGPFITLLLAFVFLGQTPTVWQLTALLPLILGTLLLTDQIHLKTPRLA